MTNTYENIADIHDIIRSYDFPGNDECYFEGVVIEKGFNSDHQNHGFTMIATKRVFNGQEKELAPKEKFFTVFEYFMDSSFTNRIVNLSK
ncbi:MAG: hypothetical protein VW683_04155 [Betaproteobacteria bacterium]